MLLRYIYTDQASPDKILAGLGEDYQVMKAGFKTHASCRATNTVIDGIGEIRNKLDLSKI